MQAAHSAATDHRDRKRRSAAVLRIHIRHELEVILMRWGWETRERGQQREKPTDRYPLAFR